MWKVVQPGALAMAEAAGIRITMSFILWGTVEVSVGSCIIHCSITGIGSQPDNHTTIKCTVKQKYKTIHSKSGKKKCKWKWQAIHMWAKRKKAKHRIWNYTSSVRKKRQCEMNKVILTTNKANICRSKKRGKTVYEHIT